MSKSEVKERTVFNKICSILIDIFIVPVILIAFICAIFMSSAKANNNVPSVMGNSIVEVLTSSMAVEGGFYPGEVLIIDQTVNTDNLKVGDCIAFYAPKASGWTTTGDASGDSLIIFHRIVRIIYANEVKNGVETDVIKKHFVCRGDNVSPKLSVTNGTLIPTQNKSNGMPEDEWGGDYDENGNIKPGGGYVVKLVDDSYAENVVINNVPTGSKTQSELQYVTSDYVVGIYKAKLGGFLSSTIKFCCSELGIILLVIIPSALMLIVVATNLVQETRLARQERESGQIDVAKNVSMMGNMLEDNNTADKIEDNKEDNKTADVNDIIANISQQNTNEKQSPKDSEKQTQPKEVPNKKEVPAKNIDEKQASKDEPKAASAKAETKTTEKPVAPKKAPAKAEPKTAPAKAEVKTAPAKAEVKVAPKTAPTKLEAKEEPKKVAPKTAPTKPAEPKKAPAKVPPKKD